MNASVRMHALVGALWFTACQREQEAPVAPPPLPEAPQEVPRGAPSEPAERDDPPRSQPAARERPSTSEPAPRSSAPKSSAPKPERAKTESDKTESDKSDRPKGWGAAYVPPPAPAAPAPVVVAPKPKPAPAPAPAPAAPAKPKTRVSIPSTEHVRVEIPSGLQADLDADPRMQPWVEKVIAIADSCHAKARGNLGAIEAQVTMRENARPDVDVRSVPAQLGSLVACATGSLLRTKMPLFTGREGTRYTVRILFQ